MNVSLADNSLKSYGIFTRSNWHMCPAWQLSVTHNGKLDLRIRFCVRRAERLCEQRRRKHPVLHTEGQQSISRDQLKLIEDGLLRLQLVF